MSREREQAQSDTDLIDQDLAEVRSMDRVVQFATATLLNPYETTVEDAADRAIAELEQLIERLRQREEHAVGQALTCVAHLLDPHRDGGWARKTANHLHETDQLGRLPLAHSHPGGVTK